MPIGLIGKRLNAMSWEETKFLAVVAASFLTAQIHSVLSILAVRSGGNLNLVTGYVSATMGVWILLWWWLVEGLMVIGSFLSARFLRKKLSRINAPLEYIWVALPILLVLRELISYSYGGF